MTIKCPLCLGTRRNLLTNKLRHGEEKSVYHCTKCDLGFLAPKDLNAKEYYDQEYRKKFTDNLAKPNSEPEEIYDFQKKFQQQRLAIIKKYFNHQKSFLEVGCSAGQFLFHIRNRFSQCEGLELNSDCANFVKKKFKIKVHTKEIEKANMPDKNFDYIGAFQTLEHTLDPVKFLGSLKKVLKDKGKIFIEVPNLYDALLSLWDNPAYRRFYFHIAHTFYFSPKSLEKLCKKVGFKIEKAYFLQDYNLFNHFYWYFNQAPQPDGNFGLSQPHLNFTPPTSPAGRQINLLLKKTDEEYKKILAQHQLTSNIFFVASKI